MCCCLILSLTCVVRADNRSEIEALYEKSNAAAQYKFLEGMLSPRTADFRGFDLKGKPINVRLETQQLSALLRRATSVKAETKVLSFQVSGVSARVRIEDKLTMSLAEAPEAPVKTLVFNSSSEDQWLKTGGSWRLKESRVLSQSLGRP